MDTAAHYWQLVRLNNSGHCQTQTISQLQTWIETTFADVIGAPAPTDQQLQSRLLTLYQNDQADADLAQLSLRCYISRQIYCACLQLANQFGEHYGFTAVDLLPIVLDDEGQRSPSYRPLSLEILDTYDPAKAQLSTWTTRRVKTHPELNRALLERGLYRASDWAILNDTSPEQLERILRRYHLCSEAEVAFASQLLQGYHQVYRRDRIQQRQAGRRGRCQSPTTEQLERIAPQHSAKVVLTQLTTVASQLRQYRIHARCGNPIPYGGDPIDWEHVSNEPSPQTGETDDDEQAFLDAYRQTLQECLDGALAQAIRTNIAKLQQRNPPKDQAYVQGLRLFHCEGLSMRELAPQVGLSSQVQVNRLLQLKRLQADVRCLLIHQLQARVRAQTLNYISADRLKQIDQALDSLLTKTVNQIMDEAAAEVYDPQRRAPRSRFAAQLCQTIHQFISNIE